LLDLLSPSVVYVVSKDAGDICTLSRKLAMTVSSRQCYVRFLWAHFCCVVLESSDMDFH